MKRIRVGVLETDPLRMVGLSSIFDEHPDIHVFATGMAEALRDPTIHLVIIGAQAGPNLPDLLRTIKAFRPDLRLIVMSPDGSENSMLQAILAGAKGYLEDDAPAEDFLSAVRIVHQGSIWAPRHVLAKLIERMMEVPGQGSASDKFRFTAREYEVLQLLVAGRSNREIAKALTIEERTVKAHIAKLMRKVGVKNRIALSVHAITNDLVQN